MNTMDDVRCKMELLLDTRAPITRSVSMLRTVGELMGLDKRVIAELICPQEVVVFRVPTKTLGKVMIHWGCMCLHNNARGPYKGGIRISDGVTVWDTIELARLMTLKTAVVDIELGGGKTGIRVDMPRMYDVFGRTPRDREFERIIRLDTMESFAQNFRDVFASHKYIPAPDVNTGGEEMAVIFNQTMDPASVTGKPRGVHGWLPGRKQATGRGCFEISRIACEEQLGKDLSDCTVAVQGFGNVGIWSALYLHDYGAKVVGVTDSRGGAYDEKGLDVPSLIEHKRTRGMVSGFSGEIDNRRLLELDTDIIVPAALGNAIDADNAPRIRTKMLVEGANMPVTAEAMDVLKRRGVIVIPDIIANAGGVIASMEEYSRSLSAIKMAEETVFKVIEERISRSYLEALDLTNQHELTLPEAAIWMASERVYDAMGKRSLI
jgi:glutamate dehydrogenase/leucine dehydrogenase